MRIEIEERDGIYKVKVNDPLPPVDFGFKGVKSSKSLSDFSLNVYEEKDYIVIEKPLDLREHVFGLGEKAVELDRRRKRYIMWNLDHYAYQKFQDPLYINIPFMITLLHGKAMGYFINSASKLIFDIGFEDYDKIKIKVPENGLEFYILEGPSIEEVIERYVEVTGKPFLPPEWAFGYMISRYSYYPQDKIVELVDLLQKEGIKVTGVFLDIDYMDSFKLFTWNKDRFYDPKKFIDELHSRGVKIITIVDHGVRADQNYKIFLSGLGKYCETDKGDLFVGKLWAGNCVYPDFFREETREWWSNLIAEWLSQGIDGIWLDMNEPTDFSMEYCINDVLGKLPINLKNLAEYKAFPDNVVHKLKDKVVPHSKVRNAYPYYEAEATFKGFEKAGRKDVFILSRSGYSGIQKYAFVWTGDSTPSWDQLKLQLQLVLGLSISGIPYVGIDIGGFLGRDLKEIDNSPEMLLKQFQISLFFPLFRTHKAKDGIDTEPIFLPSFYKEKIKEVINLRYKFLPYLYMLAVEAHEKGHPIVRPLFYEFQQDEDTYSIDDEYIAGKYLLYAPILQGEKRKVYLPIKVQWADFWNGEEVRGWVDSKHELPIYVRRGSIIPLSDGLLVYGDGRVVYNGVVIQSEGGIITFSKPLYLESLSLYSLQGKVLVNGKEANYKINGKIVMVDIRSEVREVKVV
ncbi:alpha-glucosidase MalA [Stygiolobus azoricus]|uniref:Glycoside hydrolase family 31 protein n=1 Tax=Stygiolobus azoricus TaxID=41675 RepID=A0A650CQS1_9CREN|nr:alpha-glucosidase MalA [Stygiolobus azoricus]QGR19827.1 glycoside hydrolase family 31 protein [Stygiolobus azoricus]